MKKIFGIASSVIAVILLINTLSKEAVEFKYAVDGAALHNEDIKPYSELAYECSQLSERAVEEYRNETPEGGKIKPLEVGQIKSLISKGWKRCTFEATIVIPANLAIVGFETIVVPHSSGLPYELAKNALSGSETKRCSDYIKPLYAACPALMKPYMKRIAENK
jgi:hypothetical protein